MQTGCSYYRKIGGRWIAATPPIAWQPAIELVPPATARRLVGASEPRWQSLGFGQLRRAPDRHLPFAQRRPRAGSTWAAGNCGWSWRANSASRAFLQSPETVAARWSE